MQVEHPPVFMFGMPRNQEFEVINSMKAEDHGKSVQEFVLGRNSHGL